MSGTDKFQLFVYDGDFGLPSFDVECSKSILYTIIAQVPVQKKLLNSIKNCAFYNGPCFVHKNVKFNTFHEIVLYLKTLNYDLDKDLSPKQRSESFAITNLVDSKLKPVTEFVFYTDQRNYHEFTKVWYFKALPMPFNQIHASRIQRRAEDLIESLYPNDVNMEVVKDYINVVARECLSSLSTRLGTSMYFFGNTPTTLDVVVYSYISPLLKLPLPANSIPSLVSLWPNLCDFVKRIDNNYFSDLPKEPKYIKNETQNKNSDDEISYVAISLLTFSAMSLVVGFAISRGFISSNFM
ncbi:metaxin-1 [Sitophilus oryzae]|uniref:Metaxin-1 n=1 Tax=Sitophilus oryzae TaxID=7048 RepID=A0A6J2YCA6_SITOR|nr:metaxin-1 [Sitophilus oryzae]